MITELGFLSCSAQKIPPYSILLSSRAPIGLIAINTFECCTNQGFKSLIVDSNKTNVDYLYYYIKTHIRELNNLGGGTTFKEISKSALEQWNINIPKKNTQDTIANTLSALDRKIALNRKENEILEKIAKQLYDYWFVQFDFPDENGRPYKSSGGAMEYNPILKREIPKGWEVKKLSETTVDNMTSIIPSESPHTEFKHYSIPAFDECSSYAIECGNTILSNKFVPTEKDILVSKLNPWTSRVIWCTKENNTICSTEFVTLAPKSKDQKGFFYMLAKSQPLITYCTKASTGTSHSHRRVGPEIMKRFPFPYQNEIILAYSKMVSSSIERTVNNINENRKLQSLRDFLLPLLMNGQVTIKD